MVSRPARSSSRIPRQLVLLVLSTLLSVGCRPSSGTGEDSPGSAALHPDVERLPAADPMPLLDREAFPAVPRKKITLQGDMRNGLLVKPPGRLATEVTVPPDARLEFELGLLRASPGAPLGGVLFEVSLKPPSGPRVVLCSQYLDPDRSPQDRGWQSREVDLASFANQRVGLTFSVGRPGEQGVERQPVTAGYEYAVWGHPRLALPTTAERPNVVLISLDTLRADHLGAYGYSRRKTSPSIDAWAEDAVRFENAIVQAPWTTPSHMSMLTSLYPSSHGVNEGIDRVGQFLDTACPDCRRSKGTSKPGHAVAIRTLPEEVVTLAELLRSGGYRTAAFTGGGPVSGVLGFAQGFDRFVHLTIDLDEWTFGSVTRWVRENRGRPFFLFFHTFEPHAPYLNPVFAGDYGSDRVSRFLAAEPKDPASVRERLRTSGLDTPEFTKALYDGDILTTDSYVGRLLDVLRDLGLYEKSLIVLTSDHGEEFADHHPAEYYDAHGRFMYDELTRVPLILSYPPRLRGGRRLRPVVASVDILPTVAEVVGVPAPEGIAGRSLLALAEGRETTDATAFIEASLGPRELKALRSDRYKYIATMPTPSGEDPALPLRPLREELYDLEADPRERRDLSSLRPDLAREFRASLERTLAGALRRRPRGSGRAAAVEGEMLEKLRSLGYVQ